MKNMINLNDFADGALSERINLDLQKLFDNIADPNTDAKKPRKLVTTLTLTANEKRDIVHVAITSKLTPVPARNLETQVVIGHDGNKVVGQELKSGVPGQTFMTDKGEVATDTGEVIDQDIEKGNVVHFK